MTGDTPLEDAVRERTEELRQTVQELREDLESAQNELEQSQAEVARLRKALGKLSYRSAAMEIGGLVWVRLIARQALREQS